MKMDDVYMEGGLMGVWNGWMDVWEYIDVGNGLDKGME